MWLSEVAEPVIGLTPDRWELVWIALQIVVFAAGAMIGLRL